MMLEGHAGELYCCGFSPDGQVVASAGFDRTIFLWRVFGDCENFAILPGHSGAILDLAWAPSGQTIFTVATDSSACVWDAEVGARIRKLKGHKEYVNSVAASRNDGNLFVTGGDDCTIKVWDARRRGHVHSLVSKFQVTAVSFGHDADEVISGGLDNVVKIWDLRKQDVIHRLTGHTDTISGMALSPDGKTLLTNGMDDTVRAWDVQPFVSGDRMLKIFLGSRQNAEKNLIKVAWTPDGKHVGAGSADRNVYVWNYATTRVEYALPGHKGSVNAVAFHPKEPIVASVSTDKRMYLGELEL